MYHLPEKFEDFSIEQYYDQLSDIYDHVDSQWPFLQSGVDRNKLEALLEGVEKSISLNRFEKMRIINSRLSAFQISQLIEVFVDEESEFKKLIKTEGNNVFDLVVRSHNDWVEHLMPTLLRYDGSEPEKDSDDDYKQAILNTLMGRGNEEGTPEFL